MACLDEVTFKIPLGTLEEVWKKELEISTTLKITVPDYLKILRETEYVFELENWVLTGLQGGYTAPNTHAPSELAATCPPYWMLFSSPQQSRLASRWSSDFWEPNPRPRSRSLNAAHFRALSDRVKFTVSHPEDCSDNEEASCLGNERPKRSCSGFKGRKPGAKDLRSSNLLNLPSSYGFISQRPMNFRKVSGRDLKIQNRGGPFYQHSFSEESLTLKGTKPLTQSSDSGALPVPSRPLGFHAVNRDSSVELLSALSPEERQLLDAVMKQGYSFRTAIIALQKTGQRSPEKILSYLMACNRLCQLGYDEARVEEALEMFHNCETKAEEFLYLLTQFHEMGFQENAIKEVLLVHGNHHERALEELMTHVA